MGGNAIQGACRIIRDEYDSLVEKVKSKIIEVDPKFKPTEIKFFKSKKDFGDLDLLVSSSVSTNVNQIAKRFGAKQIKKNGNVLSFGLQLDSDRLFQVDLISVPATDLDISSFYFSYNDLNLLAGRIAHKLNTSFGFDGLKFKVRTESGYNGLDINLSKDPARIYEFLDLDIERYNQGFDSLEEIYQFVSSSKYFNPSIFSYDSLNHINKTRNRKRSTYAGFLNWIETQDKLNQYQFQEKSVYLIKIDLAFPEIDIFQKMKDYSSNFKRILDCQSKFNGNLVSEFTGLTGKELGNFISSFKGFIEEYNSCDFNSFVDLQQSFEDIKFWVEVFNKYLRDDLKISITETENQLSNRRLMR